MRADSEMTPSALLAPTSPRTSTGAELACSARPRRYVFHYDEIAEAEAQHWNDDDFDVLADAVTGTIPNTEVSLGYSRGGNIFPDLRSSARLANSSYSSATVSMARLVAESVTLSAIARVCRARSRQCSGSFRYDKTSPTVRSNR